MKRTIMLLSAVIMMLSLAACGLQNDVDSQTSQNVKESETTSAENSPMQSEQTDETNLHNSEGTGSKTLIVYFTPANSDTADAISSATPRVGDVSSVEYVAQLISARVDADVAKIVPETAYPLPYNDAADQAKREQDNGEHPAFTLDVNPEEYDTIFIGYPIWWYEMPMIMQTFFETYDFSGKTIIPFNNHAGSRDGGTYADIRELEPNATVLDGLAVNGENAGKAENDVEGWLAGLGF